MLVQVRAGLGVSQEDHVCVFMFGAHALTLEPQEDWLPPGWVCVVCSGGKPLSKSLTTTMPKSPIPILFEPPLTQTAVTTVHSLQPMHRMSWPRANHVSADPGEITYK